MKEEIRVEVMNKSTNWDDKDQVLEKVKEDSNNFKKASERLRGDIDVIEKAYINYEGRGLDLFVEHATGFIQELIEDSIMHGWDCGTEGYGPVPGWNE